MDTINYCLRCLLNTEDENLEYILLVLRQTYSLQLRR